FRRGQAVRAVVKGQRLQTVSDPLSFTYSALRKWVQRFAHQGTPGLLDRPRPGRPPKVACALDQHLNRLIDQDPLEQGSIHSQWSCRALATVLAQQTGVHLGRESMVDRRLTLTRINDKILTVVTITFRVCEKLYTLVISELCQHTAIPTMALSFLPNGFRESIRFPLLRTHGSSPLMCTVAG